MKTISALIVLLAIQISIMAYGQGGSLSVRKDINSLTEGELDALRTGVREMQQRNERTDPTSWLYQANIHGASAEEFEEAWGTCEHFNYFFISWHRIYMYFEQMLREASGSPTLSLSYWDYSKDFAIPEAFREPVVGGAPNPLYVEDRNPGINDGALLREDLVGEARLSEILSLTNFDAFGGNSFSPGQLEAYHNTVHVLVGGWMSAFETAARDPIFMLGHHTNIDRLTEIWLSENSGRQFPTTDEEWMDHKFTFFLPNKMAVRMTGGEVVETANQLDYYYDNPGNWRSEVGADVDDVVPNEEPAVSDPEELDTIVVSEKQIVLDEERSEVVLEPVASEGADIDDVDYADENYQVYLHLDDISYQMNPNLLNPGEVYEVYANLPESIPPANLADYRIGVLSFFGPVSTENGHDHSIRTRFVLTDRIREILAETGSPEVTLAFRLSQGLVQPNEEMADRDDPEPGIRVNIGRAYISRSFLEP